MATISTEKNLLMILQEEKDSSKALGEFFKDKGYEILILTHGLDALDKAKKNLPKLIILDISLPDIDGHEVCRNVRMNPRTAHIPVMFITERDERLEKILGLELGADDYITRPFDADELGLRVNNIIARAERVSLLDPRSGLPSGPLIEEQLRQIIRKEGFVFMDIRINHFNPFREVYSFIAGDDVLRFAAMLLNEVIEGYGKPDDFIGHVGSEYFVITTTQEIAPRLKEEIKTRFREGIITHYNFMDRQNGFISVPNDLGEFDKFPLMSISVGMVSTSMYQFADIREMAELAAEARRMDS